MDEAELRRELLWLGVDDDSVRALALLPLVQVALVDGDLKPSERSLIVQLAEDRFRLDDEGQLLLQTWLKYPPTDSYVRRGTAAVVALSQRRRAASAATLYEVVEMSEEVARASVTGLRAVRRTLDSQVKGVIAGIATELARAREAPPEELIVLPPKSVWTPPPDDGPMVVDAYFDDDEDVDDPDTDVSVGIFDEFTDTAKSMPVVSVASLVVWDARGVRMCAMSPAGITVGRSRKNELQLPADGQTSRQHCHVFGRKGRYYVRDLGSVNGTMVNGQLIVERRLLGGEEIRVGSTTMTFVVPS
jgi:uncharacterized tellurite resistance protein B-like protein